MTDPTLWFREPQMKNAGKIFHDIYDDGIRRYRVRQASVCAYPDCGEVNLYQSTPLCTLHAEVVWKLFEAREPDLYKADIRRQHKEELERLATIRKQKADTVRVASYKAGHIYYLRIGDRVKIGFTTNMRQRMRSYPPNAELLTTHPGTPAMERDMHAKFDMYLMDGREWFRDGEKLMQHISEVDAERQRKNDNRKPLVVPPMPKPIPIVRSRKRR